MNIQEAKEIESKYLLSLYTPIRFPMVMERGEGCLVWDSEGRQYLDLTSGGRAVTVLGHCHSKIAKALCEQSQKPVHMSNDFFTEPQLQLAKLLSELTGGMKAFFCNSGAEANEAAMKLARKYAFLKHGEGKSEIITALKSFHGRTFAALSATGQEKFQKGFQPLVPGFKFVPYNDLPTLQKAVNEKICAVMLEPILGESGVYPADESYLKGAAELCKKFDALLMLDEVQTGIGRTGRFLACEHYGIKPDVVTLSKGLAGGVPIGAMLAREPAASSFTYPDHAATFGGSPIAAAAAVAALTALQEEGLIENAENMGNYFKEKLKELQAKLPALQTNGGQAIKEIRGQGLMLGFDLAEAVAAKLKAACCRRGVLINASGDSTIRLIPALVINRPQIDKGIEIISAALQEVMQP